MVPCIKSLTYEDSGRRCCEKHEHRRTRNDRLHVVVAQLFNPCDSCCYNERTVNVNVTATMTHVTRNFEQFRFLCFYLEKVLFLLTDQEHDTQQHSPWIDASPRKEFFASKNRIPLFLRPQSQKSHANHPHARTSARNHLHAHTANARTHTTKTKQSRERENSE